MRGGCEEVIKKYLAYASASGCHFMRISVLSILRSTTTWNEDNFGTCAISYPKLNFSISRFSQLDTHSSQAANRKENFFRISRVYIVIYLCTQQEEAKRPTAARRRSTNRGHSTTLRSPPCPTQSPSHPPVCNNNHAVGMYILFTIQPTKRNHQHTRTWPPNRSSRRSKQASATPKWREESLEKPWNIYSISRATTTEWSFWDGPLLLLQAGTLDGCCYSMSGWELFVDCYGFFHLSPDICTSSPIHGPLASSSVSIWCWRRYIAV